MSATTALSITDLATGAADADLLVDLDLPTEPTVVALERAVHRAHDSSRPLVGRTGRGVPDWPEALLSALDLPLRARRMITEFVLDDRPQHSDLVQRHHP
ncbi:hypothetical protein ACIPX0_49755 [Streptomyces sp. NPDC090075]|uniref:hypothetical protein n=1 Tax=Streptomyces sp. NPDC090075 TaxID=3365937 RepID=UPI0038191FD9